MAIKANASAKGMDFKRFVGVGSFRVVGVNPTRAELEDFYGREVANEPVYLFPKKDEKNNNADYTQMRVTFMIVADPPQNIDPEEKEAIKTNAALKEPLKLLAKFFIDSRYRFNGDRNKIQVIDKYGRTAWVTIDQAKNHQIPVYSNGPAKLDPEYRPAYVGEEELCEFMLNYLNVTPIDVWNKNTGQWMTNPHPEDCEGSLEHIQDYFKGNITELKEYCKLMPTNRIKVCVGVNVDSEGKEYDAVYVRKTLRNGSRSYTPIKDAMEGSTSNDIYTDDPAGLITNIHEYKSNVKETNFGGEVANDPFAKPADDLPFGGPATPSDDPFANMQ